MTARVTEDRAARAEAGAAISVEALVKRYESALGREVTALDGIDLDVRRGEFLTLIGPSGCGKSTLLHAMGGMKQPSGGRVRIGGTEVTGPRPDKIGFVFQDYSLFPWRTVLANVEAGLEFRGVTKAERRERAMRELTTVRLDGFAQAYPGELSGGMQQRVAIARALALDPELLLMDEPFGALDEQTRTAIGEELSNILARTDTTIVFVTHSLSEAILLSDRVVVMTSRPGRVKAILEVTADRPRDGDFMTTTGFAEMRTELYKLLRDEIDEAANQEFER
jgi:ABC-type nitrate/sulfonate/bicarbonate transport system ATPase subunit